MLEYLLFVREDEDGLYIRLPLMSQRGWMRGPASG
jgi:hypothetical protein